MCGHVFGIQLHSGCRRYFNSQGSCCEFKSIEHCSLELRLTSYTGTIYKPISSVTVVAECAGLEIALYRLCVCVCVCVSVSDYVLVGWAADTADLPCPLSPLTTHTHSLNQASHCPLHPPKQSSNS